MPSATRKRSELLVGPIIILKTGTNYIKHPRDNFLPLLLILKKRLEAAISRLDVREEKGLPIGWSASWGAGGRGRRFVPRPGRNSCRAQRLPGIRSHPTVSLFPLCNPRRKPYEFISNDSHTERSGRKRARNLAKIGRDIGRRTFNWKRPEFRLAKLLSRCVITPTLVHIRPFQSW